MNNPNPAAEIVHWKKSKLCWIPSCPLNLLSYCNFILGGESHTLAADTGNENGYLPSLFYTCGISWVPRRWVFLPVEKGFTVRLEETKQNHCLNDHSWDTFTVPGESGSMRAASSSSKGSCKVQQKFPQRSWSLIFSTAEPAIWWRMGKGQHIKHSQFIHEQLVIGEYTMLCLLKMNCQM